MDARPRSRYRFICVVSGQLRVGLLHLPYAATITNIHIYITATGSGFTAGQSFAALYDASNALLGVTADQSGSWPSTGEKTMALTTPYAAQPGIYKVGFWSVASTPASYARSVPPTPTSGGPVKSRP